MNIPEISRDFIEFLERAIPDRMPRDPDITPQKLAFLQGRRSVVDLLRDHFTIQQEDSADVLLQAKDTEG